MTSPDWQALKAKGNDHFKAQENLKAAAAYTSAIKAFSGDDKDLAVLYSNRSASLLRLMKVSKAMVDADKCIELRGDWDKAHFRRGAVLEATKDYKGALGAYQAAASRAADPAEMTGLAKRVEKLLRASERPAGGEGKAEAKAGDAAADKGAKAAAAGKNNKKKSAKK